uniref:Dynein heavy chain C-terminal domain-containing protein n=1 Tax=Cryptomonas curvata TaxID=233186 RepID=A0A7S0MGX1_9CRYP
MGDLSISVRQTKMMLDEYDQDQFKSLNYLIGECNYGGRVTDDKDRRYLLCVLSDFYRTNIFDDNYSLSASGTYKCPPGDPTFQEIIEYIGNMPLTQLPEVFGLNDNADITKDQQETNYFCETLLSTDSASAGGGGGGSKSVEEILDELAAEILSKVPQPFDRDRAMKKFPIRFDESMNTVLAQELIRFNSLTESVLSTLIGLRKAIKGLVLMSTELEEVGTALRNGKVPGGWAKRSYPSLKPLAGYISDFLARLTFIQSWLDKGQPAMFWMSGFFFVHAFMTGGMQNFARKKSIPVDTLNFEHVMMSGTEYSHAPEDGVYVYGLFCEAGRWDKLRGSLEESEPKILFSAMPVMWFNPKEQPPPNSLWKEEELDENGSPVGDGFYCCPLYNTSARRGVLATTGHSSNYVCPIVIPTQRPQSHWIKRGTALLMQLDD